MKLVKRYATAMSMICLAALALQAPLGVAAQSGNDAAKTRATMQQIYAALKQVYTMTLDPVTFSDPAREPEILAALEALTKSSEDLSRHGGGLDPSFEYLSGSLALDAGEALRRFERGQLSGARFVLNKLAYNCLACHSRVEQSAGFEAGAAFADDPAVSGLPPLERVSLEAAARQFDKALASYEEVFEDDSMSPLVVSMSGAFENYLRICMGTMSDCERPKRAFEKYLARPDMSRSFKVVLDGWIASIDALDMTDLEGKELDYARELIRGVELEKRFVSDRQGLVDLIAAETLLHRYLQTRPEDTGLTAEAYYLIAVVQSNVSRSYWLSETPFLLEKAIRYSPGSEFAPKAYAFLEEYTMDAYAGMSMPEEVQNNLSELRNLIGN